VDLFAAALTIIVRATDSPNLPAFQLICCQLGAREYYAIPRALLRVGMLRCLITDAWVPPSSFLAKISGRTSNLAERFHAELRDARVRAFNSSLILFEAVARVRDLEGWTQIIARNRWFQRKVVSFLRSQLSTSDSQPILLSYSYTALEAFRYAKARGWKTLLVQIDPGAEEERIVAEEAARVPELARDWQPAPAGYWDDWREECKLADRVVVNSQWSRAGLIRDGVPAKKLSVIPLAYEASKVRGQKSEVRCKESEVGCARIYPARFTQERPLRVLFLALINLRKGVARLLEAARILRDQPIEFWMVGPVEIGNANAMGDAGRVKWFGSVTRKQSAEFYKSADVFILPTLSDGFAITQLEAQAHGLPVIASKFCGDVVTSGFNGIVLQEPTAACIAATIRECIADPGRLQKLTSALRVRNKFSIEALAQQLQDLGATL
jgi:glycosyltransferase involved in cell wall biosynthesis